MRRFLTRLAALAFAASLAASPAAAEIVRFSLDNGLDVVLDSDRKAPKVVVNLVYRVGSMNEPPGRSGFAHLFEHLMFMGTKAAPSFDAPLSAAGVENNGWTMEDMTLYYEEGPSSAFPVMLSLEADRMANLGEAIDEADLARQRAIVLQEMSQSIVDQPAASAAEALRSALVPPGHPYSRSVIGSVADLQAATLDDVRGFFDAYYAPNNASLVIVGDFDPAETRALVERLFGGIARGPSLPAAAAGPAPPTRARLDSTDRVPTPTLLIAWSGPLPDSPDTAALEVAAELLGDAETGLLHARLVEEEGVATSVGASFTPLRLGGRFELGIEAAAGVSLDTLESAAKAALARVAANPLPEDDVRRARDRLLRDRRGLAEDFSERAAMISQALVLHGDPARALGDDPVLAAVTGEDVRRALRTWLAPEAASVARIAPGPRGGLPRALTETTGIPAPLDLPRRAPVPIPILPPGDPVAAILPTIETARLKNGVEIEHVTLPDAAFARVGVLSSAGTAHDDPGAEGRAGLAALVATRGAGDLDGRAFARAARDVGATIGGAAGEHGMALSVRAPPERLSEALALLSDAILRPRFGEREWRIAVEEAATGEAAARAEIGTAALIAARRLYFPASGQPERDASPDSLRNVERADAASFFAKAFAPQNSRIVSVGPEPLSAVVAALETAFGGWKEGGTPLPEKRHAPPRPPERRRVVLALEPGASQTAIVVARPAPGTDAPERLAARAVIHALAGDFESRLNTRIREEKGYSYGVLFQSIQQPNEGALLVVTSVGRDDTAAALADIFAVFGTLATVPVSGTEQARFRTALIRDLAGVAETGAALFQESLDARLDLGRSLDRVLADRQAAQDLPLDAIRSAAAALSGLDHALVVLVGDPDIVLPQLEAAGLPAETLPPE